MEIPGADLDWAFLLERLKRAAGWPVQCGGHSLPAAGLVGAAGAEQRAPRDCSHFPFSDLEPGMGLSFKCNRQLSATKPAL